MKQPSTERTPTSADASDARKKNTRTGGNVSRYTSGNAPDFSKRQAAEALPKKPPVRKLRSLHHIPVTTLPSDEHLDEVLDDDITDDAMTEELPMEAPEDIAPSPTPSSPFSRLRRERAPDPSADSLFEFVRKKTGFSEDDIAMILELGYESELGRTIGYENLKKLKNEYRRRLSQENRTHYLSAFGYRGSEDVNPQTAKSVLAAYLFDRKSLFLRTLMTALFTLLIFFLDQPEILGGFLPEILSAPFFLFPLFSLIALLGASFFSRHQIKAGLISYFHLRPTPYSAPALLLPIVIAYDLLCFLTTAPMMRVNLILCGLLLVLALCDVLRLSSEMRTFAMLSEAGEKTVLEPTTPRKKKLRQGKKLVKIINDDIDENFYRVHRAAEVTGFFRRFNDFSSMRRPFNILLGMCPALGLACGFAILLSTHDLSLALSAVMTAMLAASPISAVFLSFYPLCRANRLLARYRCALMGEEAVSEYAESKTVIFTDTELCSAEKCTEIAVRESEDFREDLRLASILFEKIGGTLSTLGRTTSARASESQVAFVRITDNGVEAVVDNRRHMIAGSAEFLKKCGIRIAKESADKALRRAANASMMYVAIDGVLKLSYEMEYAMKPAFEEMAAELAEIDTAVAIQSYDPNLNEWFLQGCRGDRIPVRVIKPGRFEADTLSQTSDTGAVALGDSKDILYPLYAAKGVQTSRKFGYIFQFILSVISATAVTVLSLWGGTGVIEWLTPTLLAAYHLALLAVSAISAAIYINRHTLRIRREQDATDTES